MTNNSEAILVGYRREKVIANEYSYSEKEKPAVDEVLQKLLNGQCTKINFDCARKKMTTDGIDFGRVGIYTYGNYGYYSKSDVFEGKTNTYYAKDGEILAKKMEIERNPNKQLLGKYDKITVIQTPGINYFDYDNDGKIDCKITKGEVKKEIKIPKGNMDALDRFLLDASDDPSIIIYEN